jgi:epoxyqueuosine reductase
MKDFSLSSTPQQQISEILLAEGLTHFGFTSLQRPMSFAVYENWVNEGMHGEMEYMKRHLPIKEDPTKLLSKARSAILVAFNYRPHPRPLKLGESKHSLSESTQSDQRSLLNALNIAHYAKGEDYHFWIKEKSLELIAKFRGIFTDEEFLGATDSSPIMERDLAYQAGLGWVGKNTCLIDQKRGSFFLIAEILTTMNLSIDSNAKQRSSSSLSHSQNDLIPQSQNIASNSIIHAAHPDRCGNCTRCIDACPTQALVAPKKLDARLCISYLTIESKTVPPVELREKIGDLFFGCDICQTVCPWNEKIYANLAQPNSVADSSNSSADLISDLRFILKSSNNELERTLRLSPLMRARGFGLKRNAMIVAANKRMTELKGDIEPYLHDPRLSELAEWAIEKLRA